MTISHKKCLVIFFITSMVISGCCGSPISMKPVPNASYVPESGESVIIFMYPPVYRSGVKEPAVFDLSSDEVHQENKGNKKHKFVGLVPIEKKVAYVTHPGQHIFMVFTPGHNAEFLRANLEEGKTYYARIKRNVVYPIRGTVLKLGFLLLPIHKEDLYSKKFKKWNDNCEFVENTEESHKWAQEVKSDMQENIHEWYATPEGRMI